MSAVAEILSRTYDGRSSPHAHIKWVGDHWITEARPLSRDDFEAHADGRCRVGAIPFLDGERVQWASFDFDFTNHGIDPDDDVALAVLGRVLESLGERRLIGWPERSKSKGWHVWIYFDGPVRANEVRAVLASVLKEAGWPLDGDTICPRGDHRGAVGNGTALPCFGGDEGGRTRFAEPETWSTVEDQVEVLRAALRAPSSAKRIGELAAKTEPEDRESSSAWGAGDWRFEELVAHDITLDGVLIDDLGKLQFRCPLHVPEASRQRGGSAVMWSDGHGHCSSARCERKWRTLAEFVRLVTGGAKANLGLGTLGFSGARLLDLLKRPDPPPVEAGIPTPGHFGLTVAPPMSGKSSQAYWSAMARAAGVAPWAGAPERDAARVLIYSIDEAPEQELRRMVQLSAFHPAGPLERYAENLVVLGPDRDVAPAALESLRFDVAGLETLARWLEEAEVQRQPFAEVFVDAYADVLPLGESENSNEEATRIGGELERLAVRSGAAIVLLHHTGKPRADAGQDLPDVRFLGRGASALAAKARVVTSLETVSGMPHLRRLRTITNLSRAPRPALFQVCSPEAGGEELLFFRPHDPYAEYSPADYIGDNEEISTNEFAWRLSGKEPESRKNPPGEMKKLASALRERWRRSGLIEVIDGPRRAKMIKLSRGKDREESGQWADRA